MAAAKTPVLSFTLPEESTVPVKIGRKTYQVNPGNFSSALELPSIIDAWRSFAAGTESADALAAKLEDLESRTHRLVASVFGDAGAEELVGGPHRLDIPRTLAVMGIIADIYSSDEAMGAVQGAIPDVADTADEE